MDDTMIGVFCHWTYGPHTVDGVVGKDNPLLLASNFSGTWPGLVALLNTGPLSRASRRKFSRIWTDAKDWTKDRRFMERLDEWCSSQQFVTQSMNSITPPRFQRAVQTRWPASGRRNSSTPDPRPDAWRYEHGNDQRLFRASPSCSLRLFRAQGGNKTWLIAQEERTFRPSRPSTRPPVRRRQRSYISLAREGCGGLHRGIDQRATSDVPFRSRSR